MTATEAQIRDLANTIALQADALATGKIDQSAFFAQINLIAGNAETLKAYGEQFAPAPVAQGKSYVPGSITAGFPALDDDFASISTKPKTRPNG